MGIIRLLLAIAVIVAHSTKISGLSFVGPITAVRGFFMISGFTISMVLVEKYAKYKNSYRLFITNRFLKIYPAYWVILTITILFSFLVFEYSKAVTAYGNFGQLSGLLSFFPQMNPLAKLWILFTNIFVIGQDTLLFLGLNTRTGALFFTPVFWKHYPELHYFLLIPVAWVIALQIYFYLIAPKLVKLRSIVLILLIAGLLVIRVTLERYGLVEDPWNYRFFPTELPYFLLGILSYRLYGKLRTISTRGVLSYVVLFGVIAVTIFFPKTSTATENAVYTGVLFISMPYMFSICRHWKFDRYIGELSYVVFLSQIFVLTTMEIVRWRVIGSTGLTAVMLTLILSVVLQQIVLTPIYAFRSKVPDLFGKRI